MYFLGVLLALFYTWKFNKSIHEWYSEEFLFKMALVSQENLPVIGISVSTGIREKKYCSHSKVQHNIASTIIKWNLRVLVKFQILGVFSVCGSVKLCCVDIPSSFPFLFHAKYCGCTILRYQCGKIRLSRAHFPINLSYYYKFVANYRWPQRLCWQHRTMLGAL